MSSRPPPPPGSDDFDMRSLLLGVFVPHALMAVGQGATAPMIALVAIELGASVARAGVTVALFAIGSLLGGIPGGVVVARFGDRRLMATASGALAAAALVVLTRPSLFVYSMLVVVMGLANAMFGLARLVYSTELTPIHRRGRVMSSIGGTHRVGSFAGPLVGGVAIGVLGVVGPFLVHGALALLASASVVLGPESTTPPAAADEPARLRDVARDHRKTFGTAALAIVAFQIVRGSRQAIIPLWGAQIGLDARQIGLLFSLSAGIEMVMFYPVGRLMDRRGRRWTAIPALTLLSLGVASIGLTSDLVSLGLVVSLMGLANGMGTGINMTLSSDLSPVDGRSVFLGLWRTLTEAGTAAGPSLVALTASLTGLGPAGVVVAVFGFGGAALLWKVVPETLRSPAGGLHESR